MSTGPVHGEAHAAHETPTVDAAQPVQAPEVDTAGPGGALPGVGTRPGMTLAARAEPPSTPTVARTPALGPRRLVRLQRAAGNRAVVSLMRAPTDSTTRAEPVVQRDLAFAVGAGPTDEELIKDALAERSSNKIKQVRNLAKAGAPHAMALIDIVLSESWGWIGPADETALETLWGTFGEKVLDQAKANPEAWRKSLEGGAELYDLPAVKPVAQKFLSDVRSIAGSYLDSNETYCTDELGGLGIADPTKAGPPTPEERQAERQMELGAALRITQDAKQVQEQLRSVPVALERRYAMMSDRTLYFAVSFDPDREPTAEDANPPADRDEKAKAAGVAPESLQRTAWKDVKAQWDMLETVMQGLSIKYPIVGIGLMRGDKTMADMTQEDPKAARAAMVSALTSTRTSIQETRPKLAGDLAYELVPIHNQLFGGQKGPSSIDWKDPVAQAVAKEVLELEGDKAFWVSMGLATLAAAAFILAEFATAGMATFAGAALIGAGVGIGAGQAIVAWEKARTMDAADQATTGGGTELLASGQADMAAFEAALSTIMVFADVASSVKPIGRLLTGAVDKAAMAAGRAAAEAIARDLVALAGKAPDRALAERAVLELGAEQAAARSGQSAAKLLEIVGEQSPAAARLKAFMAVPEDLLKLTPAELAKRAGSLATEVQADAAVGEALAALAVERLGPRKVLEMNGGWKALSLALGNESAAGKAIMGWRDAMMGDLEAFVRTLPGGVDETGAAAVQRTGSKGKFTNDFDISLMGKNASKNRSAVRSFMAGRVGTTPDRLGELLLADFFTDPRRLHLYDTLSPALREELGTRAEKVAQATIMARTLHDAEAAGNKELAARIRAQMKDLGIQEVPFKPLSDGDRAALYGKIDDYHQQLESAVAAGDEAAQRGLVQKIGDTQGLINATEGGGYFSGGATRQIVSLAEGMIKGGQKPLDAQVYTALLDQLPKLNAEASALMKSGIVASEEAVGAIKGIAKYGKRFRDLMKALEVKVADEAAWDALAGRLETLLKQAKGEKEVSLLSRLETEAVEVQREVDTLMGQFRTSSHEVLMQLNRQAAMGSQKVDLAAIQFLVMATAKLTRTGSAVRAALSATAGEVARMAEAARKREGMDAGTQTSGGGPSSSQAPTSSSSPPSGAP
ncbi:MAG: hypothetical protein KF809_14565 [Chloroflexi bacterium]|nr:hypothetical protein [Chloroflexota bacterium]